MLQTPSPHWSQVAANLAEVGTAIAVVVGGAWALLNYHRAKRRDAARWLHGIFHRFQVSRPLARGKLLFDFEYRETVEPLCAAMVFGGNAALDPDERHTSILLDRVLNYLEHLLYLQRHGHVSRADCEVYFGYWLGLLRDPERGALRRYIATFGYDNLRKRLHASDHEYLLLYGTLRSNHQAHQEHDVAPALHLVGHRTIPGQMYDLGDYPGLVLGEGTVEAELYRVRDRAIIQRLDEYEEYHHRDRQRSLFWRTTVPVPLHTDRLRRRLRSGTLVDAWVYVYNRPVDGAPRIESGIWKVRERGD